MASVIDITSARNADISTIKSLLEEQRARRIDLVVSPASVRSQGGRILILPGEHAQHVSAAGITDAAGFYLPTAVADEGLGQILGIDGGYLKKLRNRETPRTDLIDVNINGMLHGSAEGWSEGIEPEFPAYPKNLLLRLLRGDDDIDGVLRAVLSPKFRVDMDNLDVLLAVIEGFREAGVTPVPDICNLSDRKMDVRFVMPQIAALAPKLLDGYRSPLDDGDGRGVKRAGELGEDGNGGGLPRAAHGMRLRVDARWRNWTVSDAFRAAQLEGKGYPPGEEPVVFAGIRVTCSDVGEGGRNIFPELRVQACKNGLTLVAEADKRTHLGAEKQAGVIQVSAETDLAELALITQQTKDAVMTYTNEAWFLGQVRDIEALAGVKVATPEQVITDVTRANGFTKAEAAGIWDMFLMSGGTPSGGTAGQVANAMTAYSQAVPSPDRAAEIDRAAVPVMTHLARIAA
jgi:hypothetical protein